MQYRKIDSNDDYVFGQNSNGFYSGTDAVGQAIYTALKLLQGEWWEDTSIGFPLFQSVIGQPGSQEHQHAVDMFVQETVMNVQGVQEITSFTSSYANRTYTIENMIVLSQFGELTVKGVTFTP